jgi:uncharacterized membrane protein YciS (DUF1049 family)
MRLIKIILTVVVLVLIFLLIRQNLDVLNQQVQFKLNLWVHTFQSVSHPLWIIMIFMLFLAILGTGLYSLSAVLKLRRINRQLRHELDILKKELQTCKPIMASPVDTTINTTTASANL